MLQIYEASYFRVGAWILPKRAICLDYRQGPDQTVVAR